MRAAEWASKKKTTEDDDFLKPQWLQRPGAAGISNQFRSAGGRKGGFDDRRTRKPDGPSFKPGSSLSPSQSEDFPPLAPFYRSHSTGSLTPADIPSASSRLLSASKEEKHFSINRQCDFPTLAPSMAVVDHPARMHKSKSATALPQVISPSSDLLKAHHTTLSALAGAPVSVVAPVAVGGITPAAGGATTEASSGGPAKQSQHSHKKKPSFSDKVSFSEIAASEKTVAANNRAKFERAAADNQRELQRLKSLVPSKPVHPSLSRTNARPVRPKMAATANALKAAPSPSRDSFAALPASPATLRKATSAPVLPRASSDHPLSRSPPSYPPSPLVSVVPGASPSSHTASVTNPNTSGSGPSSPPRPVLMPSSRSARTLPQATGPLVSSSLPQRPVLMPSSRSARTLPQATVGLAPPGLVKHHTSFALPLASRSIKQTGDSAGAETSTPSSSSSSSSSSTFSSSGAPVASPRRRDSSPPAATPSAISRTSPLSSPRRSSIPVTGGVPHHNSEPSLLSAPLSPRMPSAATVNGGSNSASSSSSSSSSFSSSPSSSSSSAPSSTSSAPGKTAGKKSLRTSGSSSSSAAVSKQSASNGGKQQPRKKKQQQQPNGRRRSSLPPEDESSTVVEPGLARPSTSNGHRASGLPNTSSNSSSGSGSSQGFGPICVGPNNEIVAFPWLPRGLPTSYRGFTPQSEGSGSEEDLPFETVSQEELMMIATGGIGQVPLLYTDSDEKQEAEASAADEFCPFSWEARADGREWSEWSEDAVRTFMKEKLDYEVEVVGEQEDDEGQGLTEEEIRLAKQQLAANLPELLEKKKQGLSAALRLSALPASQHPRPSADAHLGVTSTAAAAAADTASVQSTSRRGHRQPSRSTSGPAAASLRGGQRRHHKLSSPKHGDAVVLDSDSDESEGEEMLDNGFPGIVYG